MTTPSAEEASARSRKDSSCSAHLASVVSRTMKVWMSAPSTSARLAETATGNDTPSLRNPVVSWPMTRLEKPYVENQSCIAPSPRAGNTVPS